MQYFRRAFWLTFSVTVLFFILIFAFVLISDIALRNGFSSGETLSVIMENGKLNIEFLGERFFLDISLLFTAIEPLKNFVVLLPPLSQFAVRFMANAFGAL